METNLKVIQTEVKIQQAFIKLVNLHGFDKLSVKDLVNETNINRGTFYLHYHSKGKTINTTNRSQLNKVSG